MHSVLFLSHRIPFPPNKGDKIRAFQILKHLARDYRIHLGCFIDDPDDWAHVGALKEYCAEVACFDLPQATAKLRALKGLLTGEPLSLAMFKHSGMANWVRSTLATIKPHAIFGFSSAVAQYVLREGVGPARIVMDFVDVDSDKWRQYASESRVPMRWIYEREARKLLAFDRLMATRADCSVFVSDAEAALFRRLAPESAAKTYGVANGIDCDYFSPDHPSTSPFNGPGPHLVFTGTMDYRPNIDAVVWFASEIFPIICKQSAQATFTVVGAKPSSDVLALRNVTGVTVTGRVEDVRPFLRHADVIVAPLRLARGIQNKVLEGMAMAKPVVTTPQGLEGIEAHVGRDLLLANTAEEFAEAVQSAPRAQAAGMGVAARKLMLEAYAWPSKLAQLDKLMAG